MHISRPITVALAAVFLGAITVSTGRAQAEDAQPIAVHAELKVGAEWKYELSFDLLISEEGESAPMVGRIVQSANITFIADRETPDGSFIIKGKFDRLTSVWRRGDTQHEFSWVRNDEKEAEAEQVKPEPPVGLPEAALKLLQGEAPKVDDGAIFQSVIGALARSEFAVVVAADGRVVRVRGLGAVAELLSTAEDFDETALGMFLPPRFAEAIETIWRAVGDEHIKKIGDTWSKTRPVRFGRAGGLDITTAWRVASLDDDLMSGQGEITATAVAPDSPSLTQPVLEVVRGQGQASFKWSLSGRELIEREDRLDLALRWTLADLKSELHQLSTRRLRRLP